MKIDLQLSEKSGIYCITNLVNNKKYIGKSVNINQRISGHILGLNRKSKDSNRYLILSWHKYGRENFTYEILEEIEKSRDDFSNFMKDRELYWMDFYHTTDKKYGYNLRQDSSSQSFVHEDTRKLQSKNNKGEKNPNFGNRWSDKQREHLSSYVKEQFAKGTRKRTSLEDCIKGSTVRLQRYLEDPEKKKQACLKMSKTKQKYYINQYSKDRKDLIKKWNSITELIEENPNYKMHNIYAVCSGEKPSMYGYWWEKVLINDKI
jgi:group I intron endonuclease